VEDALRLEEAYVSTIHGFGLRVLTEFAFESGSSPQPRLLNEDEQNALIRLALARTTATDAITENLAAYGYAYDFMSGKSAEDGFRDDVLEIIGLLRAMGWQAYRTITPGRRRVDRRPLRAGGGGGGAECGAPDERGDAARAEFPESLAGLYPTNKSATDALQKDFRNLRAAADGEALERDWNLWKCCDSCGNRSAAPRCPTVTTAAPMP
jgi:ATP-dependent helicase/nuclease subunit A